MTTASGDASIDGLQVEPTRGDRAWSAALGEALRYGAASAAALAIDASLLWAGVVAFVMPAWLAGAFGYAAGLVFIYVVSVRWVFARRTVVDRRAEFVAFAALGFAGLGMNSLVLFVATSLGCTLVVAKASSAAIGFATNFVTRKLLLFDGARAQRQDAR